MRVFFNTYRPHEIGDVGNRVLRHPRPNGGADGVEEATVQLTTKGKFSLQFMRYRQIRNLFVVQSRKAKGL